MAGVPVPDDLVLVGHVTGAYGVAGWIRIRPYSSEAQALLQARSWWLDRPDLHDVQVLQAKRHGAEVVALLMGIAGRDAAEAQKGSVVQIRRSHFPALADGEFYWTDLIGLEVENPQRQVLGRVTDLMDNGAHPILRVAPAAAEADAAAAPELLIPFVASVVTAVDLAAGKITADWGLDY